MKPIFQKILKPGWVWISSGLFVLLFVIFSFTVQKTNRFLETAKNQIETKLKSGLKGHDVRLEKISVHFLNSISFSKLEISNPGGFQNGSLLKCDKLNVRLRPLHLYRILKIRKNTDLNRAKLNFEKIVSKIEIVRPELFLSGKKSQWNYPKFDGKGKLMIPNVILSLEHCRVTVEDDTGQFQGVKIQDASGELDVRQNSASLDFSLETAQSEKLNIQAESDLSQIFKCRIKGENIQWGDAVRRFKIIPDSYTLTGAINSQIDLSMKWPENWHDKNCWNYDGNLKVQSLNGSISFQNSNLPFRFESGIKFNREKIDIDSLTIKTSSSQVTMNGSIFITTQSPSAQTDIKGNVDLHEIAGFLPSKYLEKGNIEFALNYSGKFKNPRFGGSVKISEGQLLKLPCSIETNFNYSSNTLNIASLSGIWGTGNFLIQGIFSPDRIKWDGKIDHFKIEKYFENEPYKIKGDVSIKIAGQGSIKQPKFKGKIELDNLVFSENKIGSLRGEIFSDFYSLGIKLKSQNNRNRWLLKLEKKNNILNLKQCELNLNHENVKCSWQIDQKSKKILGTVSGSVSTNMIEPMIGFFSLFQGKISLNSRIKGTLHEPILEGKMFSKMISLREKVGGKEIGPFESKIFWDKRSFKMSESKLGNMAWGSYEYWKKPVSKFILNYKTKNANPKILFAFMNISTDISGMLNGSFRLIFKKYPDLAHNENMLEGEGNLICSNGKWSETPFETLNLIYSFDHSKLQIKKFNIKQKEGFLDADAETNQNQTTNPLKINASAKNFTVSESKLDGDAVLNGDFIVQPDFSLQGGFESKNFSINRLNAGILKGTVELKKNKLSFKNCSWGSFFRANCEISSGQDLKNRSPLISGEWSSAKKEIKEWFQILNVRELPFSGWLTLSGKVTGTLSDTKFHLSSEMKDLNFIHKNGGETKISKEGFGGTGKAIYSKKSFQSISLKLDFEDKSQISLLGQANTGSHELKLETFFKQFEMESLLKIFGIHSFKSKADGHLTIQGDWKMPWITGEMTGKEAMMGTTPLESWQISGKLKENEILINRLTFLGRKNSWRFSVTEESWIKPSKEKNNGIFKLAADFANISLGPVSFVGNGTVEGNWSVDKNTNLPVYQGNVKINECLANNFELKPAKLRFQFYDQKLKFLPAPVPMNLNAKTNPEPDVSGLIDFSKLPSVRFSQLSVSEFQKRIFFIDGEYSQTHPSFKAEGIGIEASLFSGILQIPLNIEGETNFKIEGLTKDENPVIKGECVLKNGRMEKIPLDDLVMNFKMADHSLTFAPLQIRSKNYFNITVNGGYPVKWGKNESENSKINLKIQCANGNLSFLNYLENDWIKNAQGPFSAQIEIRGKTENPVLNGNIKLTGCEFDSDYLSRSMKNLTFHAQIKSNQIQIQKCEGTVGKGKLKIQGSVQYAFEQGDFFFDNFNLSAFTPDKNGIPVQIPELPAVKEKLGLPATPSKGTPQFSIKLSGKKESPKCSGWIQLDDTLFSYPPPKKTKETYSWLEPIDLDMELRTGNQTIFQNDFAYAKVHGQLKFNGTRNSLTVRGKVNSEDGTITFFGSKFNLSEAVLEIVQPQSFPITQKSPVSEEIKNIAYLQLKAEQETFGTTPQGEKVPDTVTLKLERTPLTEEFDSKKITFYSSQNPNLSSDKVAARAGLGIDLETATPEERDLQLRQGIARLLDSQLASPLARMILQRTGLVDKIEITQDAITGRSSEIRGTESSALDPLIGQSILLERTFGSKLGVGYKATFDRIKDKADLVHQLQLRYPFYKGMWLYGTRELDSKENLGREPESKAGIETRIKFDPADWFKKSEKKGEKKK